MTMTTQGPKPTAAPPAAPPTITSANLKPPVVDAPAPAIELDDDVIEARPLQMPDFVNIKPKNPNISFRWVNYTVGEKQSSLRFDQMRAAGFEPAVPADVEGLPAACVKDGRVMHGDLILMKIPRKIYLGAKKYKNEMAIKLGQRGQVLPRGETMLKETVRETNAPPNLARKIAAFTPTEAEVNAATSGGTGRQ